MHTNKNIYLKTLNRFQNIANAMGLDTSNNMTLWKDRVALELNTAVLSSFSKAGVAIVDQHSSTEQYMVHMNNLIIC